MARSQPQVANYPNHLGNPEDSTDNQELNRQYPLRLSRDESNSRNEEDSKKLQDRFRGTSRETWNRDDSVQVDGDSDEYQPGECGRGARLNRQ